MTVRLVCLLLLGAALLGCERQPEPELGVQFDPDIAAGRVAPAPVAETPSEEPEPAAEPEPAPEPAPEPPPEPEAQPAETPPAEAAPEPKPQPEPTPAAKPAPQPATKPVAPPAPKPAPEPAAKPTPKPATPAPKPVIKPAEKPAPRPEPKAAWEGPNERTEKLAPTVVVGRVLTVSTVPEPGTVPYTECVTYLKYAVVEVKSGRYEPGELLAVHWGMKDGKLMPAAKFRPGDRKLLTIEPFDKHPELQRVMSADETNEFSLSPYWVVAVK